MYMHFWRTKGTLPGIIANVKAASPQENRALQRCSALFYPVLGQQNPLNYFIYLIPRFYVSTSKSIIKALINMHSFEIQLSPIG